MKGRLKHDNSTRDKKEEKKHCNRLNIDFRNGPCGKKQVWKKKKENQGTLPGKIFHVWFIGDRSFSSCPWLFLCNFVDTNAAPLVCLLLVQRALESMLFYIFNPRADSNSRRKSIHGFHPCGNLIQSKIKKKEICPDMRSKKKKKALTGIQCLLCTKALN